MKYYYSTETAANRRIAILEGRKPPIITLYPETPEILEAFNSEENHDWWCVHSVDTYSWIAGEYPDYKKAMEDYLLSEAETIYSIVHDI